MIARTVCVLVIIALFFGGVVYAHNGRVSDRDDCHKDKTTGILHDHVEGTRDVNMICERNGNITIKTPAQEPTPTIEEYEQAFVAAIFELRQVMAEESARVPEVLAVETPYTPTEECSAIRKQFVAQYNDWAGRYNSSDTAMLAITEGCWR